MADATLRKLGLPGVIGRKNCDDVLEGMASRVGILAKRGCSVDVRRGLASRSSAAPAKLVRTALHHASILFPSLVKFRFRFAPGEP